MVHLLMRYAFQYRRFRCFISPQRDHYFMCVELMLNAVNLLMVAFSRYLGDSGGQVFVFFIMVVAAAEVSVGLAILMMIYRNTKSVDIDDLNKLKW